MCVAARTAGHQAWVRSIHCMW